MDDRARIVVGVDGSECARAALEFALAEAARRDAELDAVSVVPTLEYWPVGFGMASYSAAMPTLEQIISEVEQETRGFVDSVVAEQGESVAGIALRVQTVHRPPCWSNRRRARTCSSWDTAAGAASPAHCSGRWVCTACCTLRARSPSSGQRHSRSRSSPRPVPPPPHQGESRGLGGP